MTSNVIILLVLFLMFGIAFSLSFVASEKDSVFVGVAIVCCVVTIVAWLAFVDVQDFARDKFSQTSCQEEESRVKYQLEIIPTSSLDEYVAVEKLPKGKERKIIIPKDKTRLYEAETEEDVRAEFVTTVFRRTKGNAHFFSDNLFYPYSEDYSKEKIDSYLPNNKLHPHKTDKISETTDKEEIWELWLPPEKMPGKTAA